MSRVQRGSEAPSVDGPYSAAVFDASQGIAEVNWGVISEAKRHGRSVETRGRYVLIGIELGDMAKTGFTPKSGNHVSALDTHLDELTLFS